MSQRARRGEGAQDILGRANQEPSQVGVAPFTNAQLGIVLSALVPARAQTDEGTYITHLGKTRGVLDLQNEVKRGDGTYTGESAPARPWQDIWFGPAR